MLSGVGDEVNQKELEMLASSYDHVYLLKNVNALSQIQDKLAARFCRGKGYLWSQVITQTPVTTEPDFISQRRKRELIMETNLQSFIHCILYSSIKKILSNLSNI